MGIKIMAFGLILQNQNVVTGVPVDGLGFIAALIIIGGAIAAIFDL